MSASLCSVDAEHLTSPRVPFLGEKSLGFLCSYASFCADAGLCAKPTGGHHESAQQVWRDELRIGCSAHSKSLSIFAVLKCTDSAFPITAEVVSFLFGGFAMPGIGNFLDGWIRRRGIGRLLVRRMLPSYLCSTAPGCHCS